VDAGLPVTTSPDVTQTAPEPRRARKNKGGNGRGTYGKTAKVGALWSIARQGGNELIAIPTSMVMARLLSPSDFGIAAAALFFVVLAARLTQFGFNAALVRVKDLRPEHTTSVFVATLGLGVLTYGTLYLAAPAIGIFFRSEDAGRVLPIAAIAFLINPFGTVPAALMQRHMLFRYKTLTDWLDAAIGAGVSIAMAFAGYGYWSLLYGNLVASAINVVVQMYLSGWWPRFGWSSPAIRELLSFGLGIQAKRVLEYAAFNLDNLVVGRVLGMTALGFYDKAFTTMNRLVNRLTLGQTYFRIFSVIHEEPERFRRAYSRLILTITLIGLPAFTSCIVLAEPLFLVLYGNKWLPAVVPFQLLCVAGMFKLLNAYASQANEATGNVWPQARRQGLGTLLIVLGAAFGSRWWGVTGAACGVMLAMAVLTAAMQGLVRRATGLSWRAMLLPQLPGVVCALLLAVVLTLVARALHALNADVAAWQLILVQGTIGVFVYAAFLLFSPFAAVREVVAETIDDLLPAGVAQALNGRKSLARAQAQP
jgi:PST family polysaccharide transporter